MRRYIDATWLIRRNFYAANKGIVEKLEDGTIIQDPDKVIVSFLMSILKIIKDTQYQDEIYCLFDKGTWRYKPKDKYTNYKSNRDYSDKDMWQCCWDATSKAIEIMPKIGINTIQIPGVEADDLGSYYAHQSHEGMMMTSDHDWLLSVTPNCGVELYKKGEWILNDYDSLMQNHIKDPFDLAIEKAILGDESDNIPKVKTGLKIAESIDKWKNDEFDGEIYQQISTNLDLVRVDYILEDKKVHNLIKEQEANTRKGLSQMNIIQELSAIKKTRPYFLDVLSRYNKTKRD